MKGLLLNPKTQSILLLLTSIVILVSLIEYKPNDPSFNVITIKKAENFFGEFGANCADFLYQFFGAGAFIFPLCLASWAIIVYIRFEISWIGARIIAMFVAASFIAVALSKLKLSILPIELPAGMGGAIGSLAYRALYNFELWTIFILAVLGISSLIFSLSIESYIYAVFARKAQGALSLKKNSLEKNQPLKASSGSSLFNIFKRQNYQAQSETYPKIHQPQVYQAHTNQPKIHQDASDESGSKSFLSKITSKFASTLPNNEKAIIGSEIPQVVDEPKTSGKLKTLFSTFVLKPKDKQLNPSKNIGKKAPVFASEEIDEINLLDNLERSENEQIAEGVGGINALSDGICKPAIEITAARSGFEAAIQQRNYDSKSGKNYQTKYDPSLNLDFFSKPVTQTEASAESSKIAPSLTPQKTPIIHHHYDNASQQTKPSLKQKIDLPSVDLLKGASSDQIVNFETAAQLQQNAEKLLSVLNDFGVKGQIIDVRQGPVVTLYEFEPAAGTKSSRVIGLADDIARSLSAISTRIAVVPGRNVLGIELPNKQRAFFCLRELIETPEYKNKDLLLPLILGKDLAGRAYVADLAKMPHLLVAGTTGSGKSVAINTMIMSLLYRYTPEECRLIMIDPKMLELSVYDNIPHLLTPVVTEPSKAVVALKWAVKEMENRYRAMSNIGVRNIAGYNEKIVQTAAEGRILERTVQTGFDPETGKPIYESIPISMEKLPYIVVIVDEMADLMLVAGKDIESSIQRLAQMARAAGIHIIMATQRPSVDVITGVIKANFPSRISFRVTSKIDSRTILGEQGSEQLLGMGDMLYMGNSSKITRVHGPFVDDNEVEKVTQYLRDSAPPSYISAVTEQEDDDEYDAAGDVEGSDDVSIYKRAVHIVKTERKVSISYIQRCLRIGYNKAADIIEKMEREGVISAPGHGGKREVLLPEH